MLKPSLVAAAIYCAMLATACGGATGDADEPAASSAQLEEQPEDAPASSDGIISIAKRIAGPADSIQRQLDTSVFKPLADTAAGTSLESLVHCADAVVVHDMLDVADSVLAGLDADRQSDVGHAAAPDARQLTDMLGSMSIHLTQLLHALAGSGTGCTAASAALDQIGFDDNLLAGTPFATLGAKLGPLLVRVAAAVERHDDPDSGEPPMKIEQIAELMTDIDYAMQLGLQQVPLENRRSPIVGGVLNAVATALTDNSRVLAALLGNDDAALREGLRMQLEHTLVNSLVQVLPVRAIETQAGQPDLIALPVRVSVADYGALWAGSLGVPSTPTQTAALRDALAAVFAPIESDLLPIVLIVVADALDAPQAHAGTPAQAVAAMNASIGLLLASNGSTCQFATLPSLSGLCRSV
ncbi:MAG TPA: hypothetical protein VGE51_14015 [Fontimonas sp.]